MRKLLLILMLLLGCGGSDQGDEMFSQGFRIAGTGADDSSVGTYSWSLTSNITASDGAFSTCNGMGNGTQTHYLKATNFGFSIPSKTVIRGIVARVAYSGGVGNPPPTDTIVKLVKGGSVVGNNKALGTSLTAETPTINTRDYGSSLDDWGVNLTSSDVNSSNFGFVISVTGTGSTAFGFDYMSLTVYYDYVGDSGASL